MKNEITWETVYAFPSFHIEGDIDDSTVANLIKLLPTLLENTDMPPILNIFMSTAGGSVSAGANLINLFRDLKDRGYTVVTIAIGEVSSIGVDIYAEADYRIALPGSCFMIHKSYIASDSFSTYKLRVEDMQTEIDNFKRENKLVAALPKCLTLPKKQQQIFNQGKDIVIYKDQAKRWGLVNAEII